MNFFFLKKPNSQNLVFSQLKSEKIGVFLTFRLLRKPSSENLAFKKNSKLVCSTPKERSYSRIENRFVPTTTQYHYCVIIYSLQTDVAKCFVTCGKSKADLKRSGSSELTALSCDRRCHT